MLLISCPIKFRSVVFYHLPASCIVCLSGVSKMIRKTFQWCKFKTIFCSDIKKRQQIIVKMLSTSKIEA